MKRALRAELICRPLVERLLHSCFEIESELRMLIADQAGPCDDETARAAFARFLDPSDRGLVHDLYPREHPAPPDDVWDFVSLAGLLRVTDEYAPELLALRNSLSHGHYACWHAVTLLRRAIARLGQ